MPELDATQETNEMGESAKDYSQLGREDEPDTRVQDPEKAHAMALDSHEDRSDAARYRNNIKERGWVGNTDIKAKGRDERADRLEHWAGALHDNPVEGLSSRKLEYLESMIPALERQAEECDKAVENYKADEHIHETTKEEWVKQYSELGDKYREEAKNLGAILSQVEEGKYDGDPAELTNRWWESEGFWRAGK